MKVFNIMFILYQMELIFGRFQKQTLLKKTSNKEIWLLLNTSTGEKYVGKFQSKSKLDKVNVKNVLHEASFLQQLQGHTGVPLMYWSGVQNAEIMVISQYLGYTLEQRLRQCGDKFSLKTTCMLGIHIINIIRNLHEKGIIHRNLNPSSFQYGRGLKSSQLYMNDLIDCKRFRNKKTYTHIPQKKGIKFSYDNVFGSARYHRNEQISRIDDIQSIVKMMICFLTGLVPNKKGQFNDKNGDIPNFLKEMSEQCLRTDFAEDPNYEWFIQKLKSVLFHHSWEMDGVYDWMISPKRIERLRVKKSIISLKLDEDKDILSQFYDPYEQTIDIDEVTSKHYKFYGGGQTQSKVSHMAEQNKKGMELQTKIKKRKTSNKDKPDCSIM